MHNMFAPARRLAALSALGLIACEALAQTPASAPFISSSSGVPGMLAPVVVTSTRFEDDSQFPVPGATVISAEEIREAGVTNVTEALSRIGGVATRSNGGSQRTIDLRGFANQSSDNNLVIMLDGVRLSENELAPAILASVPVDSVQRIEIIRGGGSVLYGEGAIGGVIRIITKRPPAGKRSWGSAYAGVGSFSARDLRASAGRDFGALSIEADIENQRSDGWRDNSASRQRSFTGTLQYRTSGGRVGFKVDRTDQDTRFAGTVSRAQFEVNPRVTTSPNDFGSLGQTRYTLFAQQRLGDWDLGLDLSQRERTTRSAFVSFPSDQTDRSLVTQFSPRLRHASRAGNISNEFTVGVDVQRWSKFTTRSSAFSPSAAAASQQSRALYLRNEIGVDKWRLAAGVRQENFDKDFRDPVATFGSTAYTLSQNLRAWELQAAYAMTPGNELYAKAGQSYRLPNADDNANTVNPNAPLLPQVSHDQEVGASVGTSRQRLTVRLFQHNLRNEIMFNPLANAFGGANDNLPATRRRGVELEGRVSLLRSMVLSLNWQHIKADFTEGPNAGREVVLVPRNTAAIRLNWLPGGPHSASAGVVWMDAQRYGSDFTNACSNRIPGHATLDARYAWRHDRWEFALAGTNLADRRYYTNAFNCTGGIYPENGRAITASLRRDF